MSNMGPFEKAELESTRQADHAAEDAQQRAEQATRDPAGGECNSPIPHAVHGECPGLSPRKAHRPAAPQPDATELSSAPYVRLRAAERDAATLRADVERLTGERDAARNAQVGLEDEATVLLARAVRAEAELTKAQGEREALRGERDAAWEAVKAQQLWKEHYDDQCDMCERDAAEISCRVGMDLQGDAERKVQEARAALGEAT